MKRIFLLLLFPIIFAVAGCQENSNDLIQGLSIQHQTFINKPVEEVYESYTTKEGLMSFLAPSVKMTLSVDSTFITSPEINADLNEPGHVKNKILIREKPNRLLLQVVSAPPYLPYSNELNNLSTLIEFKPKNDGTEVIGTTYGFDKLSDSSALIPLFKAINQFTFDQLKQYNEGDQIDWAKNSSPFSPEKRIRQFKEDDIWLSTYRMFDVQVRRPILNNAIDVVSTKMSIERSNTSLLFFIATNLDQRGFSLKEFKLRMPYARDSYVQGRLQDLIDDNLIIRNADYDISELGKQVINHVVKEIDSSTIPNLKDEEQNFVIKAFEDIIREAMKPGFSFWYPSSLERSKALINSGTTNQLKLVLLMDGMNTLINDVSHYGYENLEKYEPSQLFISHPERELMGSISFYKGFRLESFLSRPIWGYSKTETLDYLQNLIDKELVEISNQDTLVSQRGVSISDRAGVLGSKIFFASWLVLSSTDYQNYKSIIDKYLVD